MIAMAFLVVLALVFAIVWISLAKKPGPPLKLGPDTTGVKEPERPYQDVEFAEESSPEIRTKQAPIPICPSWAHEFAEELFWSKLYDEIPLPHSYGEDTVVALVRNPYSLYIYWEQNGYGDENLRALLSEQWYQSKPVLRIFDVTAGQYPGQFQHTLEIEVGEHDDHWFVNEHIQPGHSYIVSYERRLPDGRYYMLSHSAAVQVPYDTPPEKGFLYERYGKQPNQWSDTARR